MELKTTHHDNGVVTVRIPTGNLDASNVRNFRDTVEPFLKKHEKLVIDMSELNFVDSSGLGALITCMRNVGGGQGQLRLFGLSSSVQSLFELMRMHRVFAINTTEEEALRSFT